MADELFDGLIADAPKTKLPFVVVGADGERFDRFATIEEAQAVAEGWNAETDPTKRGASTSYPFRAERALGYTVSRYAADGWPSSMVDPVGVDDMDEAHALIAHYIGIDVKDLHERYWPGLPGDIEAYREHPADHPRALGCGSYVVRRVTR